MPTTRRILATLLVPAVFLTACGKGAAPKKADAPPAEFGVYISSADCAEAGKLTEEQCIKVINAAVTIHQKESAVYKYLQKCESSEGGLERCDKTGEEEYRPRLQAFYVTLGNPPSAVPLYPPKNSVAGFRTATKQAIDARDPSLHISNAAMTVASENTKLPKPK